MRAAVARSLIRPWLARAVATARLKRAAESRRAVWGSIRLRESVGACTAPGSAGSKTAAKRARMFAHTIQRGVHPPVYREVS